MRYLVTGGAGFIGSSLVDRLLSLGHEVVAYDNFSTGFREFIKDASIKLNFSLVEGDLLDLPKLTATARGCDFVFHLAANADVRFGTNHPEKDLQQNTIGTFNVLEAMRAQGVRKIAFSSTGSVYGESNVFPTPEDAPFPVQTSLYAASKLAGEALISAYCEGYGFQGWIFRFVSVLGERYTHGHVFDFFKKLSEDPTTLHILGNGRQKKSYMYVQDCIDAMLLAVDKALDKVNVINLGNPEYIEVNNSVVFISKFLNVNPNLTYGGGDRGWIGDNPFIFLDTKKIFSLGWMPKVSIQSGVERTLKWLQENTWVYEVRK